MFKKSITPPLPFHRKNIFSENLTKIIWKYQKHFPLMKNDLKITESGQIIFMDKVIALIIPKKGSIFNSKRLSSNDRTIPSPN